MSDINIPADRLKAEIKNNIIGRVAVAGIGNIMRGDDGLGPKVIELLRVKGANAALFDCGTAPENYIFPILKSGCDTLILVDAANMGMEAGSAKIIGIRDIANVSFSTHGPSPRLFIDLIKTGNENMNIFAISVQSRDTSLGSSLSAEVSDGLTVLAEAIYEALV